MIAQMLIFSHDTDLSYRETFSTLRPVHPPIAQLVEQLALNEKVLGSIPSGRTHEITRNVHSTEWTFLVISRQTILPATWVRTGAMFCYSSCKTGEVGSRVLTIFSNGVMKSG
jgi:hypothetical protein